MHMLPFHICFEFTVLLFSCCCIFTFHKSKVVCQKKLAVSFSRFNPIHGLRTQNIRSVNRLAFRRRLETWVLTVCLSDKSISASAAMNVQSALLPVWARQIIECDTVVLLSYSKGFYPLLKKYQLILQLFPWSLSWKMSSISNLRSC